MDLEHIGIHILTKNRIVIFLKNAFTHMRKGAGNKMHALVSAGDAYLYESFLKEKEEMTLPAELVIPPGNALHMRLEKNGKGTFLLNK
ncbi:hypothetical protein L2D08_05995 [Domibacillus sp. PGB-M46]|uniref:hypothetical protein n=1 Tax=Domibacillus sp. PGB-M46 TaxID=2910255 RepID=UPI001F592754|nr:hypothetical protein [Domibacillus sp. PGB-M46]MCI2253912.1 hypothetical protein [Domibacillus sp. PGB-M46]